MRGVIRRMIEGVVDRVVERKLSLSALDVAIDLAVGNQVPGDYLEFGVYRGDSFIRAYKRFVGNERRYGLQPSARFFAFDSFAGLPDSSEAFRPEQYQSGAYASGEEQLNRSLRRGGIDLDRVHIVKKWFNELGPSEKEALGLSAASVVYLDCDVYESTKSALNFVEELLVDGSVIVFDDFYRHRASRHHGVRRAWEEFLAANTHLEPTVVHLYRRIAFAINRVDPAARDVSNSD